MSAIELEIKRMFFGSIHNNSLERTIATENAMRSVFFAAILLACAAAVFSAEETSESSEAQDTAEEPDVDDEPDKTMAAFMIVVEHPDKWRCGGSLVSLRTALTSAWCVRGRAAMPARELWALAAAAALSAAAPARIHGARRVSRLAVAAGADAELADGGEHAGGSWRGAAMDLALVELEEPFGSAARAQPIFMATSGEECALGPGAQCHVSRAVLRPSSPSARFSIVSAELASPETCDAAAAHWSAVRDRAFCLAGSELCESDWGASVVCAGRLCGVVSRSVRHARSATAAGAVDTVEPEEAGQAGGGDTCGDTHAAQSVARWRRFLHCAHTLRACGRGGDCADLCVERRLIEEPEPEPPASPPPTPQDVTAATAPFPQALRTRSRYALTATHPRPTTTTAFYYPTRSSSGKTPVLTPARTPAIFEPAEAPPSSLRPAFEFEPNRADFKATDAPARTTRVYLKAGEYGDNAAEYGGGEEPAGGPASSAATAASAAPSRTSVASTAATPAPARKYPPAERRAAPSLTSPPANRATIPKLTPILFFLPLNTYLQRL